MSFFARRRAPAAVVAAIGKLSSEASALAEAGRVNELRMLLNASPQMARSADEHGFTLLMHACGEGHIESAESQGPRASADADHLHRWQSQSLRAISAPEAPSRCALITSGRAIPPHLSRLGSGAQSRWHPSAAGRFCHAPLCHRAISCEFLKPGVRLTRTRRLPEAFDTSLPAIRE